MPSVHFADDSLFIVPCHEVNNFRNWTRLRDPRGLRTQGNATADINMKISPRAGMKYDCGLGGFPFEGTRGFACPPQENDRCVKSFELGTVYDDRFTQVFAMG